MNNPIEEIKDDTKLMAVVITWDNVKYVRPTSKLEVLELSKTQVVSFRNNIFIFDFSKTKYLRDCMN